MQVRLAIVAICAATYGCATPEQQTAAPSAAQAQPQPRYVTGSRLPVREEETGASNVSAASKAAYEEEVRRTMSGSYGK